jgi:hypothetical protein
MAIRMTKPWRPLDEANVKALPGQLGVYELADDDGKVVAIAFAGGRSLFGLRGELEKVLAAPPSDATRFRCEVNMQYQTRYRELLMAYHADHGHLPSGNQDDPPINLGRLSPL